MNFWKITAFACLTLAAIALVESGKEGNGKDWEEGIGEQMQEMRRWEDEQGSTKISKSQGRRKGQEWPANNELLSHQQPSSHLTLQQQPSIVQLSNTNRKGTTYERFLSSNPTTNNPFISGATSVFHCLFAVLRNLIIVGLLSNSLDIFLPYLILSQTFLMLGFWATEKHYLFNLFNNVFSSRLDAINICRLIIQPSNSSNVSQLSQYGFSSIAAVNLSGQLLVAFLLLAFTILAKVGGVCAKYECLRRASVQLRAKWNGYFFAILPRVVTFTGLHWRGLGLGSAMDALNGITCTLLMLLMVFYLVMLIMQTRRIVLRQSAVEYTRKQIGLVGRIDYKRQFNFDCLKFSSLHYPSMNYLRLLVYCLPIGILWDCQQVSFGGPIAAQFFMLMIQISSSGYFRIKDKIMFPLQNFALLLIQICLLVIGLAENAFYSPISEQFEIVLYCLLILLIGSSIFTTASDAWQEMQQRCNNKITQDDEDYDRERRENDTTQHFVPSKTKKTEISQQNQDNKQEEEEENDKVEKYISSFRQNTTHLTNIKIKKVKAGNKPQTSLFFA